MAYNDSTQVSITVAVNPSTTANLSNTASVTSSSTDPNGTNDSATEGTVVNEEADLSLIKSDSPDPVIAGNNLIYTLSVTNNGPSDATGVTADDTLPAQVEFVSAPGCTYASGTVTCTIGTVAAGATVPTDITVRVLPNTPAGSITNDPATVTSPTPAPVPGNETDDEITLVERSADLRITKADSIDPVIAGTNLTYDLTVTNVWPFVFRGVEITSHLGPSAIGPDTLQHPQGEIPETFLLAVVSATGKLRRPGCTGPA